MNVLQNLKARFPKLIPALAVALTLGTAGSVAAYQHLGKSCCAVGSPCCYPGSPCCDHQVAQK
jgi:hypothetical protein